MPRPHNHDIIVVQHDRAVVIARFLNGECRPIERVTTLEDGEVRARLLAAEERGDAWVRVAANVFRLLP